MTFKELLTLNLKTVTSEYDFILTFDAVSDGTIRLTAGATDINEVFEVVLTKENAAEIVAALQSVLGPVR